jgi:methionyl-tRNA formyltransferase
MPGSTTVPRLRTVFCSSGGIAGAVVLERLAACERLEICAVVRSTRVLRPQYGFLRGALAQIRASGIAYPLYLFAATTLADGMRARRGRAVPAASRPGLPVLATRDLNDAVGLKFLRDAAPDLLVSAFFNQRVHAPALAVPRVGCLNIHPSLLPAAKGVDPVFQCLLHGRPRIGVTVHEMTPELDAGSILAQSPVTIPEGASVLAATELVFAAGAALLVERIPALVAGERGRPQTEAGDYQSWPTPAQVRELKRRGVALWRWGDL